MIRWMNCVVFETLQDFEENVEDRMGRPFFSGNEISKPDQFPAYFELKSGYYYYWWPIEPKAMLARWDATIMYYQTMRNELAKIMLDK